MREKVRPASLLDRESAKKFAPRAQIGPNSAFLRVLGELFRGRATGGAVPGEFFRGPAAIGARGRTLLLRWPGVKSCGVV